jgi:hypothetical protein
MWAMATPAAVEPATLANHVVTGWTPIATTWAPITAPMATARTAIRRVAAARPRMPEGRLRAASIPPRRTSKPRTTKLADATP